VVIIEFNEKVVLLSALMTMYQAMGITNKAMIPGYDPEVTAKAISNMDHKIVESIVARKANELYNQIKREVDGT